MRKNTKAANGSGFFFFVVGTIIILLLWALMPGFGGAVSGSTRTIYTTVTEIIDNTMTIFTPANETGHSLDGDAEFRIQIDGGGNWNCLVDSDTLNLTVDGDWFNTTKADWQGGGFAKIYGNASFVAAVGSIIIVDVQVDNASVEQYKLKAFLVDSAPDTLTMNMNIC